MKKQNVKKGNKYSQHSKIAKEGEVKATGGKSLGGCQKCDCCLSTRRDGKVNLCLNCYFGLDGHEKYGKPRPRTEDNQDTAGHV